MLSEVGADCSLGNKKPQYFLSYAHADMAFAHRLAADLLGQGVRVWVDRLEIQAGQHWDNQIEEGLTEADALIFVMSPKSVASANVMDEVFSSFDDGKRIVPVLYRPCVIPVWLRRSHFIDFTKGYSEPLAALLDSCADGDLAPQLLAGSATQTTSLRALVRAQMPFLIPSLLAAITVLVLVFMPREWVWLSAAWRVVVLPTAALAGILLFNQLRERSLQRTAAEFSNRSNGSSRVNVLRKMKIRAQRTAISFLLIGAVFALTLIAIAGDRVRPVGDEVDLLGAELQFPSLVDEAKRLVFRPLYYQRAALDHVVESVEDFPVGGELPLDWDIQMIDGVANGAAIEPYLDGIWIYSQTSLLLSKVVFALLFLGATLGVSAGLSYGITARYDLPLEPSA